MNPDDTQRDRKALEIFGHALEMAGAEAVGVYLEGACGRDTALRTRLDALLANHVEDSFLQEPAAGPGSGAPVARPAMEQPGDHIDRYRLLEKIGEGGCGVVYMAEQEEPVRRRVALKVIKPGMDTKSVIARFEAERQALAMMDHPHIAKVHDGGVTDPGRPFFVMELVRGVRITQYCQDHTLTTRDRLDLFTAVCSAVQHAHQKGIIHRDLKPSNILVTELDGHPVPKVIDFGIAKATEQKLTDKTLFTQFAQFVGTPAYMSPEQAAMSGADIDTRSDIYSLGVLLYELLTGTTPFDAKELLASGLEAMCRTIRDTDPPKPSTRLTQSLTATATRKQPADSALRTPHSAIEADLDWIVMKCLEKDRARRYETASGLAADIQRHLSSEPVTARPASAAYRFRKMVRRNRTAFAAGTAVLAALLIGLVISTGMFFREKRARERAVGAENEQNRLRQLAEAQEKKATTEAGKSRQVAKFLTDMLSGVGPSVALGDDTKMLRKILDQTAERAGEDLKEQPEVEAELRTIIGKVYDALGEYGKAGKMLGEALEIRKKLSGGEHREVVYLLNAQAQVFGNQGELDAAEAMLRDALEMDRKLAGMDGDVSTSLNNLGLALADRGQYPDAEKFHREALAMSRKFAGNDHKEVAIALNNLAVVLQSQQKFDEAETALREALEIQKKQFGSEHPDVAITLNNLANTVQLQNQFKDSEMLFREILPLQRKLLGNAHPNVATALNGLALALHQQGRNDEAEPLLREGVDIEKKARSSAHPETSTLIGNLGRIREGQGKFEEAEALYREALTMLGQLPGPEHPAMASWRNRLVNLFHAQMKWPELEAVMRDDLASASRAAAAGGPQSAVAEARIYLAYALRKQLNFPEAEALLLECNKVLEQNPKVQRELHRETLSGLVSLYEAREKPDQAGEWQQKLDAFEKEKPPAEAGKNDPLSKP